MECLLGQVTVLCVVTEHFIVLRLRCWFNELTRYFIIQQPKTGIALAHIRVIGINANLGAQPIKLGANIVCNTKCKFILKFFLVKII